MIYETRVITQSGIAEIGTLCWKITPLISLYGDWVPAEVRNYGQTPIWRVTLKTRDFTKVVLTAEHQTWMCWVDDNPEPDAVKTRDLSINEHPASLGDDRWSVVSVLPTGSMSEVFGIIAPPHQCVALDHGVMVGAYL